MKFKVGSTVKIKPFSMSGKRLHAYHSSMLGYIELVGVISHIDSSKPRYKVTFDFGSEGGEASWYFYSSDLDLL